ncbi:MAG: acyltransferase 3 [Rhodospirillaceae bacterium]|nr:MAG: acyltransferase 3 [Rhodospirillaceae bacterium]
MTSQSRRFLTLDATRGAAAICVMLYHFTTSGLSSATLFPNAAVAVDYFFCLSGFILSFTYEQRLRDGMTTGAFMTRRLVRLYPLYLLCILLGVAAELVAPSLPREWGKFVTAGVMALLFLPAFVPIPVRIGTQTIDDFLFPLNPPSWSLFYELVVNWIYGVARPSTLAILITMAISFACYVQSVHYHFVPPGFSLGTFGGGLARSIFFFLGGVLVFRIWQRVPPRLPAFWPILSCVVLVAICALPYGKFTYLATALLIPILVWSATVEPATRAEQVTYSWLGELSYPIYVIHAPLVIVLQPAIISPGTPAFSFPIVFTLAGAVVLAAFVLSRTWDIPVRRALARPAERLQLWLAGLASKPWPGRPTVKN